MAETEAALKPVPNARGAAALMLRRMWQNFRENRAFVDRRLATRRDAPLRIVWQYPLLVAVSAVVVALIALDHPVAAFRGEFDPAAFWIARLVTDVGKSGWILLPSALFAILTLAIPREGLDRARKLLLLNWSAAAMFVCLAVGLSGLIATLLKRVIGRARPEHLDSVGIAGFEHFALDASFASFPSGHATTVGALAMVIALLAPALRRWVIPVALLLAFTRVLVGAHFVSDVIAGLLFGAWFSYVTAVLFARRGLVFRLGTGDLPDLRPAFVLAPWRLGLERRRRVPSAVAVRHALRRAAQRWLGAASRSTSNGLGPSAAVG